MPPRRISPGRGSLGQTTQVLDGSSLGLRVQSIRGSACEQTCLNLLLHSMDKKVGAGAARADPSTKARGVRPRSNSFENYI